MNNFYLRKINEHRVISFDVFDTLLKRNVRNPDDVFVVVQREYNKTTGQKIHSFPDLRKVAEQECRKHSKKEEVTLDSIYDFLPYDISLKEELKRIELSVEESLLTLNHDIKILYDYALQKGKEIIIVSDMYLPKPFIENLLHKFGYVNYHKLYISSCYGITKRSGSLFKFLLNENNYISEDVLHIGDAMRSDYLMPLRLGIHAIHIRTYKNRLLYAGHAKYSDINYNILSTFINNTTPRHCRYEKLGYETLGPVLAGFCIWLEQQRKKFKLEKLLFLSRDGQIMSKSYQLLYPESKFEYVYTSRRSMVVPLICLQHGIKEIFDVIPFYRYVPIRTLFERLGLNFDKYTLIAKKYGFDDATLLTKDEYLASKDFVRFFNEIESDILKNSKEEIEGFKKYMLPYLSEKVGIVDIGWKGTMQSSLAKILNKISINTDVLGFYIGILSNIPKAYGYYFDLNRKNNENTLMGFSGLLEILFSADHGSVKRYNIDGTVQLYDFEYEMNEKTQNDYRIIHSFQKGALDFVRKYSESSSHKFIEWNPELAFSRMISLGITPNKEDLKALGDISFFEHKIYRLAHPSSFIILFPFKLKKEFSSAPWKIGYLKRLLKLKFPYLKIYKVIRRLYK